MTDTRNIYRDLLGIVLILAAIFIGVSLFTYDASDSIPNQVGPLALLLDSAPVDSDSLSTDSNSSHGSPNDSQTLSSNSAATSDNQPAQAETASINGFGKWGALTARIMFSKFGIGAFFILASLIFIGVWNFRQGELDTPVLRTAGWLFAMVGIVIMASLIAPNFEVHPSPLTGARFGAGGSIGTYGADILQSHFATIGSLILSLSILLAGMMMFSDYAVFRMIAFVSSGVAMMVAGYQVQKEKKRQTGDPTSSTRRKTKSSDMPDTQELLAVTEDADDQEEYEEEVEEEDDRQFTIKIRARSDEEADEEFEDDDTEEETEEETDEVSDSDDEDVESNVPAITKPHFKIKRPKRKPKTDESVRQQLDEAALVEHDIDYQLPNIELLVEGTGFSFEKQEKECRQKAVLLEKAFQQFNINVKVVEIETGPVIAQYEIELEPGLRLSKITGLSDDIAIALRVPSVRIVAPIPDKNTVGIEIPNETRQTVHLRDVMEESTAKTKSMKIPLFLGKDVSGNPLVADLAKLPHLLIAGRTGTGKSVCLNAIITSILMTRRPDEVRMLMIDPKMVELSGYGSLPHLMHPVVTDMRKAEAILAWAVDKMEERYALLAKAGVRHVTSYNQLGEEELMERMGIEEEHEMTLIPQNLPFIVIVADEMADLMMTAGKEVEAHIIRLAQKSRAVGIHLILATQKPTVDVITGLIKSNLPARISFQVASKTDSRVVLDENGADKLLGNGDMLFLGQGTSQLMRGQGTFLDDDEIESVTEAVSTGEQNFVNELVNLKIDGDDAEEEVIEVKKRDELYEDAIEILVREGRGSLSLLQRALEIGYGRAARLVDFMAEDGIVGPYNGSKAREVLITPEQWAIMKANKNGDSEEIVDVEDEDDDDFDPPPNPTPPKPTKPTRRKKTMPPVQVSNNESATVLNSLESEDEFESENELESADELIAENEEADDEFEEEIEWEEADDESEVNATADQDELEEEYVDEEDDQPSTIPFGKRRSAAHYEEDEDDDEDDYEDEDGEEDPNAEVEDYEYEDYDEDEESEDEDEEYEYVDDADSEQEEYEDVEDDEEGEYEDDEYEESA